jgi:hypothetical protein
VGNDQPGLVDLALAVEQEIEVERARRIAHRAAFAPLAALDREQLVEQIARREVGPHARHRIEIGPLLPRTDRVGLVHARRHHFAHAAQRAQRGERRAQMALAIAEVGSERDVGDRFGCARIARHGAILQLHCRA